MATSSPNRRTIFENNVEYVPAPMGVASGQPLAPSTEVGGIWKALSSHIFNFCEALPHTLLTLHPSSIAK